MSIRRTIGKLAKEAGVGVETVRFYERKGLIEQPRSGDGFRHYGDETLAAVKYIKIAQRMGLSLGEIAKLRGKMQEGPGFCAAVRATARRRLEGIAGEIAALRKLESELTAFLERCGSRLSDAPCPILIELGALDGVVHPKPRQRGTRP
jgi:MerR family mercuric resistance operon transcriptional regulator